MRLPIAFLLALASFSTHAAEPFWKQGMTDERHEITVYRSASCGCCKGWIDHLKEHNFDVKDVTVADVNPYKQNLKVPRQAASCHTAVIDGVVIEGHVPAQDIKRVVADKQGIRLLTVPAMPSGTPGMDMPGAPKDDFKVFAISNDNNISIYNSYSDY
ncbi:MAG: DUF411 domain-containing protein [Gammaproteobacteria bacterium]|nr:DUF411 domain-containing protein [Gammaproteobacteria bacterium]